MHKHIIMFFCLVLLPILSPIASANATQLIDTSLQTQAPDATECATKIFADALARTADPALESEHETVIQQWIYQTFEHRDVVSAVLDCPEIANAADDETIKFMPIMYKFEKGREIIVNYKTQPKLLKQKLLLADKRGLPNDDPNPRLGDPDDTSIWTNTDPAWYAIMVVQHGALDNFVGPDKNNTLALSYIKDHIDELYPNGDDNGGDCTARSALADNDLVINAVLKKTVNIKDDTNDYYIAGDINLQWISYLEIALDVVITVVTFGGGTVISGITKSARAARALDGMKDTIKVLSATDEVNDWRKASRNVKNIQNSIDALDKVKDADKIKDLTADLAKAQKTLDTASDTANVKKYLETTETFAKLNEFRRGLRAIRAAQRGNIAARAARVTKATKNAWSGNKLIAKGAKLGRSSGLANRAKDFLFHSTMKNAGTLAKLEATGGLAYGAIKFIGGMYDWTETETGDYTSGIEFAPLLLLSADDIKGQENVVNHGMWFLWMGDSISDNDDDAAYLQAMDFAAKFHEDLTEYQDGNTPCNVDIYVVRPILRNPGSDDAAIYYLIMNDEPWTTNE